MAKEDLGHLGGLKPESVARALARKAAKEAGRPRALGDRAADLAEALLEREKNGEPIPSLSEETLEDVVLKPGSGSVPMLLSALVRQQARRTAAGPSKTGTARMGAAPSVRSAAAALAGHGPLSAQVRKLLPSFGTAYGTAGRLR